VADRAVGEDGHVGGAGADVDHGHAEIALVGAEHAGARRARVQHQPLHFEPAAAHAFQDVLGGALRAGDDVHLDLEPAAAHAHRFLDLVAVDDEFLRLDQQQPLVVGDVDGLGGLDHARHVHRRDLAVVAHDDHAGGVLAADVAAGDAGVDAGDLAGGHHLGLLQRLLDALHGGVDVDDDAALQAVRRRHAEPGDTQLAAGQHLGDHGHDLGGADVQADDQVLVLFGHGSPCYRFWAALAAGTMVVVMPRSRTA
jgi:hypothetical protein